VTGTPENVGSGRWHAWLPFVLAAAVLAGFAVHGASLYGSMPRILPTHYGFSGEADAWGEKSFGTVFGTLAVGVGTTALMAFLTALVPAMSPAEPSPSAWRRIQREGAERGAVALLGVTSLLTALLTGTASLPTWRGDDTFNPAGTIVLCLALLGAAFPVFAGYGRWASRRAEAAGVTPSAEEAAEDRLWLPGGIYNDPATPEVMVPKRAGHGYGLTVNVGHRKGRSVVAVFLVLVVGLPLGLGMAIAFA